MAERRQSFVVIGLVVGAVAGFLTRPSITMIGQLPFMVVMTRGANLTGIDKMLIPSAQESFNHLLLYTVLGVVSGFAIPTVIRLVKGELSAGAESKED